MTLEEAVAVLNRFQHRGDEWAVADNPSNPGAYSVSDMTAYFTKFEAVAIAKEYLTLEGTV